MLRLLLLLPTAALAHDGPAGHGHPHGVESVIGAAFAIALCWGVWRLTR